MSPEMKPFAAGHGKQGQPQDRTRAASGAPESVVGMGRVHDCGHIGCAVLSSSMLGRCSAVQCSGVDSAAPARLTSSGCGARHHRTDAARNHHASHTRVSGTSQAACCRRPCRRAPAAERQMRSNLPASDQWGLVHARYCAKRRPMGLARRVADYYC